MTCKMLENGTKFMFQHSVYCAVVVNLTIPTICFNWQDQIILTYRRGKKENGVTTVD